MCVYVCVYMYVCITNILMVTDKVDNKCIGADTDTESKVCGQAKCIFSWSQWQDDDDNSSKCVYFGKVLCGSGASDLMKELFDMFRVY